MVHLQRTKLFADKVSKRWIKLWWRRSSSSVPRHSRSTKASRTWGTKKEPHWGKPNIWHKFPTQGIQRLKQCPEKLQRWEGRDAIWGELSQSHKIKPKFRAAKTARTCGAKLLRQSRQKEPMVIQLRAVVICRSEEWVGSGVHQVGFYAKATKLQGVIGFVANCYGVVCMAQADIQIPIS